MPFVPRAYLGLRKNAAGAKDGRMEEAAMPRRPLADQLVTLADATSDERASDCLRRAAESIRAGRPHEANREIQRAWARACADLRQQAA